MRSLPQRQARRTSYASSYPAHGPAATAPPTNLPMNHRKVSAPPKTVVNVNSFTPSEPISLGLLLVVKGQSYGVDLLPPGEDHTKAYRLSKADGEVYDVCRDRYGLVTCTCPSYEFRLRGNTAATCKHGAALVTLGMLEAPRPVPRDVKAFAAQSLSEAIAESICDGD